MIPQPDKRIYQQQSQQIITRARSVQQQHTASHQQAPDRAPQQSRLSSFLVFVPFFASHRIHKQPAFNSFTTN